jgi:hypothetical protein
VSSGCHLVRAGQQHCRSPEGDPIAYLNALFQIEDAPAINERLLPNTQAFE